MRILKVDLTMYQEHDKILVKVLFEIFWLHGFEKKTILRLSWGRSFFRSGDHGDAVPPLLWPKVSAGSGCSQKLRGGDSKLWFWILK